MSIKSMSEIYSGSCAGKIDLINGWGFKRVLINTTSEMLHLPKLLRCCRTVYPLSITLVRRYLTSAQTAEALRPFLFAVHPDFFGQHPAQRETNERSLKHLFAYIDQLQKQQSVTSAELTFYLRNGNKSVEDAAQFKSVVIHLTSGNLYTTITGILEACAMPTALIRQFKQENDAKGGEFPRPVDWHPSYYTYTGKIDPKDRGQQRQKKPEIVLRYWLKTNVSEAREKLANSQPMREEAESLRRYVMEHLGLVDVRWESMWDVSAFRACLKTVQDLCKQHWAIMQNLRGSTVLLGDMTRLTPMGVVMLGSQDVPHQWLSFVASLPQHREIVKFIEPTEHYLSTLLGGCSITADDGPMAMATAHSHHQALIKLVERVEKHNLQSRDEVEADEFVLPQDSLGGLTVVIEGSTGEQYMDSRGCLHISGKSSAVSIIRFLRDHSRRAGELHNRHKRDAKEEALLIARCLEELELATLTRDLTVTSSEMITCCQQLERNPVDVGMLMRDLHVLVTHHYALMRNGEVCIPWDWKE